MHAVDTNVVVRCLALDDAKQSPLARDFIDHHEVLLLPTVLIECEWVMRSVYRLGREQVATLLRQFAGLPTVSIDQPTNFARALEWFEQGMDFADAMHLACTDAKNCDAFATFDRKLVATSRKARAGKIKAL